MIATRGMEFRKMNGDKADDEREDDRLLLDYALSLAAERDEYLAQRDAYLKQRDIAIGERNELRRQLDIALGERNELRRQLDIAFGERAELRRQLDIAVGERAELRRQLDAKSAPKPAIRGMGIRSALSHCDRTIRRCRHTGEVAGSIPAAPTIRPCQLCRFARVKPVRGAQRDISAAGFSRPSEHRAGTRLGCGVRYECRCPRFRHAPAARRHSGEWVGDNGRY
jgi:hypothetical protein